MIAVQFYDDETAMGWYAFPQVPSIGECVTLLGVFTAEVRGVLWEWAEVPRGALSMVNAGLASTSSDDQKLIARVRLHLIERRESEA